MVAANFSGSGSLTVVATATQSVDAAFSGDGALTSVATRVIVLEMELTVLDPEHSYAPTSVTVVVTGGWPEEPIDFDIDGTVVASATLDTDGAYGPISLGIEDTMLAGTHTITVTSTGTQPAMSASGTFTLAHDPPNKPAIAGPDADPVLVPASLTSTGVRRWVLQDLAPAGLGSWVMPRNPSSMSPPPFRRTIAQEHTTAVNGKFDLSEPHAEAHPFEFAGYLDTQADADKLVAFFELKRRFYVIDHRGRAWTAVMIGLDLRPRLRQARDDGTFNDWVHDYTVHCLIHTSAWKEPV